MAPSIPCGCNPGGASRRTYRMASCDSRRYSPSCVFCFRRNNRIHFGDAARHHAIVSAPSTNQEILRVAGIRRCKLRFLRLVLLQFVRVDSQYLNIIIQILQIRNIMDNWQANPAPCKVTWIGAYLSIPDCAPQTPSDS